MTTEAGGAVARFYCEASDQAMREAPSGYGEWVRYDDYATERAAREAVEARLAEEAGWAEHYRRSYNLAHDQAMSNGSAYQAERAQLAALRSRCEGLVEVGNELAEHAQHHPDCSLTPNGIDGDCWCGYFGTVERWRELLSAGGET